MRRVALSAVAGLLVLAAPAQAHFRLVGPFGGSLRGLQRIVEASHLPQPNVTVTVWPMSSFAESSNVGGGDFWGQRPFLITVGGQPSPDELFHELGHAVDDGWQTPGQRCAFERIFGFAPHGWFFSDGSDAASDNWAQVYALASVYGAHPPRALVREWTGMPASDWSHAYAWVLAVARRSSGSFTPAPSAPQSTTYCG